MHISKQGLCRVLGAILVLLLLTCAAPTASAVTPNDVRNWYGVGLQQDVKPLLAELQDVAWRTRTAEVTEMYNKVLLSYPVEKLDSTIAACSTELLELSSKLKTGVDMPFEELLAGEQRYYAVREQLNQLLSTRDVFASIQPREQTEDIVALHESIVELEKAISTAGVYEDIGKAGLWPAKGVKHKYNSGFGSRWDPITNDRVSYHAGVDLYSPMSTPTIAVFSGTVYKTGFSSGSGNYIYVDHGHGVRTFYCHLSVIQVKQGQNVLQGTQIALSGNTGSRTTGPHLHFGVYIDGKAVDPKVVLERD